MDKTTDNFNFILNGNTPYSGGGLFTYSELPISWANLLECHSVPLDDDFSLGITIWVIPPQNNLAFFMMDDEWYVCPLTDSRDHAVLLTKFTNSVVDTIQMKIHAVKDKRDKYVSAFNEEIDHLEKMQTEIAETGFYEGEPVEFVGST